jgi:hypothetical protein
LALEVALLVAFSEDVLSVLVVAEPHPGQHQAQRGGNGGNADDGPGLHNLTPVGQLMKVKTDGKRQPVSVRRNRSPKMQ